MTDGDQEDEGERREWRASTPFVSSATGVAPPPAAPSSAEASPSVPSPATPTLAVMLPTALLLAAASYAPPPAGVPPTVPPHATSAVSPVAAIFSQIDAALSHAVKDSITRYLKVSTRHAVRLRVSMVVPSLWYENRLAKGCVLSLFLKKSWRSHKGTEGCH